MDPYGLHLLPKAAIARMLRGVGIHDQLPER